MSRARVFRRIAIVVAAVFALATAGSASAFPAPTGSTMTCRNLTTGYDFVGTAYYDGGWRPNSSLDWQRCVIKLSTGERYAKVQLTSEWPDYKWFWGEVDLDLQTCFPQSRYETIASTVYNAQTDAVKKKVVGDVTYEVGTQTTTGWVFQTIATKKSFGVGSLGFRIRMTLRGAVVEAPNQPAGAMYFVPGSPQGAPPSYAQLTTGCFSA